MGVEHQKKEPFRRGETAPCFSEILLGDRGLHGGGRVLLLAEGGHRRHPARLRRADVHSRVERIVVFGIQIILHDAQGVAKALEMHDLPRAQELERIAHIRVVDQAQQVVIGRASLLLCCNRTSTTSVVYNTTEQAIPTYLIARRLLCKRLFISQ